MPDYLNFGPQPPSGPYGVPPGNQGYQPSPYDQGQGYGPPGSYNPGYQQPMPGAQYNTYPNTAGYQQPPSTQPNQYFPNPAFDVGYQPNPYGQSQPGGAGYQTSPYQQPPQQLGFGAPPGQYPAPTGYNPSSQPYGGWQGGDPSQYNQPPSGPSYPYGQGEGMERAQHGSMLSAEPVST